MTKDSLNNLYTKFQIWHGCSGHETQKIPNLFPNQEAGMFYLQFLKNQSWGTCLIPSINVKDNESDKTGYIEKNLGFSCHMSCFLIISTNYST